MDDTVGILNRATQSQLEDGDDYLDDGYRLREGSKHWHEDELELAQVYNT